MIVIFAESVCAYWLFCQQCLVFRNVCVELNQVRDVLSQGYFDEG